MKQIRIQLLDDSKVVDSKIIEFPAEQFQNIEQILNKSLHETPDKSFHFAIGKTWNEIKNIFQYNLIMYFKINTEPSQDTYKALKMNKPTYYSVHRKLVNKGYDLPDFRRKELQYSSEQLIESLQEYIRRLDFNDWSPATRANYPQRQILFPIYLHNQQS